MRLSAVRNDWGFFERAFLCQGVRLDGTEPGLVYCQSSSRTICLVLFYLDTKKYEKKSRPKNASAHMPTHLFAFRPGQRSYRFKRRCIRIVSASGNFKPI